MKKIWLNIYLFFKMLMYGLKGGEDVISSHSKGTTDGPINEQHDEEQSVYKDLLKGEVTQAVRELRHEMYYSERKANKYIYKGNGLVEERSIYEYNGNIDLSDGNKVLIVQENIEDSGMLSENIADDLKTKSKREFTIKIERDFIPTFRLEEFATKLVVKDLGDGNVLLDIYVSEYPKQFVRRHRPFVNEINKIYEGDVRSSVIDFNTLGFMSFKAYGTDDYKMYKYNNVEFADILRFDGSFVLRFTAHPLVNGFDTIEEFYDKIAQEKSDKKELRENGQMDFADYADKMSHDQKFDVQEAQDIYEQLKGNDIDS